MLIIDISLINADLYQGCGIQEVAGRLNLTTHPTEAMNIIVKNVRVQVEKAIAEQETEVTLTGAMAVWAYLSVFHEVLHRFKKVWYNDGRSPAILVAAHG